MLFNSFDFAFFLPIVFLFYWIIPKRFNQLRVLLLLLSSLFFYGYWNWKFLSLIVFSSLLDYFIGKKIEQSEEYKTKKFLLAASLISNLGLLGFFKYCNFFIESFVDSIHFFGSTVDSYSLSIVLPVGISFYTFQTMSYTIDVYNGKTKATQNLLNFMTYVSFFPQLVAGPIEKSSSLLPQFSTAKSFNKNDALDGSLQIIWGLFKKVVVADNCAYIVNQIFESHSEYEGSTLLLGIILFSFQIYCDFSGYSDIAIGTAKLFGIRLNRNFNSPYFAQNISDFWNKWHISLTSWFREYVYFPLGGSKNGKHISLRNIFIVFFLSGLWHGANWTFIIWGLLNAFFFIPHFLFRKNTTTPTHKKLNIKFILGALLTYFQILIGWVFFRSDTLADALIFCKNLITGSFLKTPYVFGIGVEKAGITLLFVGLLIIIEWIGRRNHHPFENFSQSSWKWFVITYALAMMIFLFGQKQSDFIYFQF